MVNERITENIVRNHVYSDDLFKQNKIIIEEQSSVNNKINKLLLNASKSGNKKGYTEFIIQYDDNPSLIIVVECKAQVTRHESPSRKQYKDFAVDGVLLYASFLSKQYDVIAIAVSGQNRNHLRISHFLQLQGTQQAHEIFKEDELLNFEDYLSGYKTDERKFNQDFQELLKYSKTLNDKLHSLKVKESERSLLISGTLIALTDEAFLNSYQYESPQPLANLLISKINQKLSLIQTQHIKDIVTSYAFIKTHTILSKQANKLKEIIDEIDNKINRFIKTYKYFDTLGQFYIEFLRYANNDKGLGIVLTPPHITELFCEIANVNKDSVVLDTCTGTGGFLISAMQKMIKDAGGDTKKEKQIKEKQIVGVELQHDIYSLLCSNMYMHGDGRSNLMKGSCFDKNIKAQVAKFKPNVGFLNPPYKTNKEDKEELEFVLNNLEQLEKGSYCIAIIPMSCAIATKGIIANLKEQILKKHTLEAVFSMPNELFKNSDVGTVTCVIVIRAKEPHTKGYKSYFSYWKNDGFYNMKIGGRADYDNKWEDIKYKWLTNYRNREIHAGHSITKEISYRDEWCSEAYMITDYSSLKHNAFSKSIKDFIVFKLKNNLIKEVLETPIQIKKSIEIFVNNWRYFDLIELFHITGSKSFTKKQMTEYGEGQYPYVVTSSENNGVQGFYNHFTEQANVLTIDSATIGSCFYQPLKFSASDHVEKLIPQFDMNVYTAIFLKTIIEFEKFRYGYGRKFAQMRIKQTKIKLPVKHNSERDYEPDWQFMEDYIKSLPYSSNL